MKDVLLLLQKERLQKGYSQSYVGARLDITQSAYRKIESGETRLTVERFILLIEILEIDISNIFSTRDIQASFTDHCSKCTKNGEILNIIKIQANHIKTLQDFIDKLTNN